MRIELQNTLDDYREANGISVKTTRKLTVGRVLAWVVIATGFVAALTMLGVIAKGLIAREPVPWARLAVVLAPSLILFALCGWAMFRAALKVPEPWNPPPKPSQAPTLRGAGGWLLFIGLAVMLFQLLQPSGRPPRPLPGELGVDTGRLPSYFDHVLPLLGWAMIFLVIACFNRVQRRRGLPMIWAALRHESEPRLLHATEAGITLEQVTARQEFAWPHFAGYRETERLILLYTSPYAFLMVPKRAFADPLHLASFKALLMTNVPRGHFLPTDSNAFPVVPTARLARAAAATPPTG